MTKKVSVAAASIAALTLNVTAQDKGIKRVGVIGKEYDTLVHILAVSIIISSMPMPLGNLDASRARDLINAMPKGGRRKALVAWFTEFSNIRVKLAKDGKVDSVGLVGPDAKTYTAARPLAAHAKPYYDLIPEPEVKDMDDAALLSAIKALVGRADKAKEAGKLHLSADNVVVLDTFRKLAA